MIRLKGLLIEIESYNTGLQRASDVLNELSQPMELETHGTNIFIIRSESITWQKSIDLLECVVNTRHKVFGKP